MSQSGLEVLRYGCGKTLVGDAVVFVTDKGVRALRLFGNQTLAQILNEVYLRTSNVDFVEDSVAARGVFKLIDAWLAGKVKPKDLKLDLRGPEFHMRVWREMIKVPHGQTWTYTQLASRAGRPRAARAAASACARNPVGLLVPCHRIVREDGSLGGYYWGLDMKRRLLAHERAKMGLARQNHLRPK